MRGLILLAVFAAFIAAMAVSPYSGLLAWAWFSFMHPHRETFGFTSTFSFDWYVAVLTMAAWLFSRDRKFIPMGATPVLIYMFAIWICVTTYFAIDRNFSYDIWERTEKSLILVLFVMLMTNTMVRMQALVWVIAMALGYFAVKGAGFVLLSGGGLVFGPIDSMITANNHLSVALAAILPLLVYLYRTSVHYWVKFGCAVVIFAIIVTVVGTYSRGGFLAFLAIGGLMALRSRAKVQTLIIGLVAALVIYEAAPQQWWDRMQTITATEVDTSVQSRYSAWQTAWNVAVQRPIGGGFRFGEQQHTWDQYSGLPQGSSWHAAHNMYFQVLGEHGFFGLAIFIGILLSTVRNTQVSIRIARKKSNAKAELELANALQLSILGLAMGSVSLSLAYYDGFLTIFAMTFALRRIVEGAPVEQASRALPRQPVKV